MALRRSLVLMLMLAFSPVTARAQIFGTIRGTVVDPQGNAIPGAKVMLKGHASDFRKDTETDETGAFTFAAVSADAYTVEVRHNGFRTMSQSLNVGILSAPLLRFSLPLAGVETTVGVTTQVETVNQEASSPPVTVEELEIQHTPGADRAASIAFITDFVPGSFLLHDRLHMRGGHQVSWLVDGVPVPNTNLLGNVGRQIDPKDIENVEVSRGGYSSRYGDRTYGVVNIVPRSGFEFAGHEFDLTTQYGSFNQTNNQLNFGGHSTKFSYYGSVSANRTDLGLEPPERVAVHNNANGSSGFTSLNYNLSGSDQLRLTSSVRRDHYWIPNTEEDQALGIRDVDDEKDGFLNFSWIQFHDCFDDLALLSLQQGGVQRRTERSPDYQRPAYIAVRRGASGSGHRQGSPQSQHGSVWFPSERRPLVRTHGKCNRPNGNGSTKTQRKSFGRVCRGVRWEVSMADKAEFHAELIEGHKGVTVVVVPFDPEEGWSQKPVRLDSRRHGWLITGTVNGVPFDGYIGERWGRFFIIIEPELRAAARVSVGDKLRMIVQPTASRRAFRKAVAQSKVTTAPRKPRADAIDLPPEGP